MTFHSLHAFASRMISRGTSENVLANVMGHESSTHRVYAHLFDAQQTDDLVRRAISR